MRKTDDDYDAELITLQTALVESQAWAIRQGLRIVVVFEGRDTAGKDGAIKRMTEYMSPRQTRVFALPKPTDREATQWYFQRYVPHMPAAGETSIFNRSWYNRAGVEPVMGFCTPEQHARFLADAPRFERMLTDDGIVLIKLWLDITKGEQAKRLEARRDDPLKRFKVSDLDAEAQARWDAYSDARDRMLAETHRPCAPWTVIATDKKKKARLNILRHVLHRLDAPGIEAPLPDPDIVFPADGATGRVAP
ncbi:polyphosphate kinase 2 [Brevundimonas sp. PAMC22021]|uniref:polyphosphate kinase 2 n=1 Tax=Brevundimonas sp. PAMC22021 TaxID=2861285 RepID=UPI001C629A80|nr:polyphosphate kinase 2 [Brevundimonas sp. PAMC22021]QYF86250.1 polyphosphate kinase 2 [Brevundimonas sp. PAMC22021]